MAVPASTVLEEILTTETVRDAAGRTLPLHSHITREEGEFLQEIIRRIRPQRSLEIGCAYGISSLFICDALRGVGARQHTIIDPQQHTVSAADAPYLANPRGWDGIGLLNLQRAGHGDLVELIEARSEEVLPRLVREGRRYEFAFIDGWHTFDAVLVDFFFIDRMLSVGGVIVFDDVHYDSIRKAVRYVLTNRAYAPFLSERRGRSWLAPFHPWLKPELVKRDGALGLSDKRWLGVQKTADDNWGDGTKGSRRWDYHAEF